MEKQDRHYPWDDNCWTCKFCKKGKDDKQPMCYNLICLTKKDERQRKTEEREVRQVNDITITLTELEEMVRRMKNSGATHLRVDAFVNCDTAEIEEFHLDSCDNDIYLDTVFSYYLK